MNRLALSRLRDISVSHSTIWLLESVASARATFAPMHARPPSRFEPIRRQARIESVESSNRIEGVTVDGHRLVPLVMGDVRPRDRSEEEVRGYAKTLEWILADKAEPPLTVGLIQSIHLRTFRGRLASDAGELKSSNNDIIEFDSRGVGRVVFQTVDWRESSELLGELCMHFHQLWRAPGLSELLVLATFIIDYLCVHPFRDGNGRTSRLISTMLFRWMGWCVVEYVSLERLIEQDRASYYQALREAQTGWHEGKSNPTPWWNFLLGILRRAHDDAARLMDAMESSPERALVEAERAGSKAGGVDVEDRGRVEAVLLNLPPSGSLGALIRAQALEIDGPFRLADLVDKVKGASEPLVRKTLQQMKAAGEISLTGRGRGAVWRRVRK